MKAAICMFLLGFSVSMQAATLPALIVDGQNNHDFRATTPQGMRRQELVRLIKEAGRDPVERDTLYRPVNRTETSFTVAV